jgi:hypothetical protein
VDVEGSEPASESGRYNGKKKPQGYADFALRYRATKEKSQGTLQGKRSTGLWKSGDFAVVYSQRFHGSY